MIEVEKVRQDASNFVKGEKRQLLPFKIHWTCPECQQKKTQDLTERYLSYPKWNMENSHTLYCGECMEEVEVQITPTVDIEIQVKKE